jgi:hypothetical protein
MFLPIQIAMPVSSTKDLSQPMWPVRQQPWNKRPKGSASLFLYSRQSNRTVVLSCNSHIASCAFAFSNRPCCVCRSQNRTLFLIGGLASLPWVAGDTPLLT